MAFSHDVDPSGTPICSSRTWAELFYAINEKENYMGYTTETSWSNGSARPAVDAFVGKPRHEVLSVAADGNIKKARDVLDSKMLTHAIDENNEFVSIEDITGWTPYMNWGNLYNIALGNGTDWATPTANLDEVGQGDSQTIKEMLSIVKELKAFSYNSNIPPPLFTKNYQIKEIGSLFFDTTTDLYHSAIANGVLEFGRGHVTYAKFSYDEDGDKYYDYLSPLFVIKIAPNGANNPAATTLEARLGYDVSVISTTNIDVTFYMRESNATEWAAPTWIPDEAVPLISTAVTDVVDGEMTTEANVKGIVNLNGDATYFRIDIGTSNPFATDPNEDQATWVVDVNGGYHMRFASTNWTYE